MNTGILDTGFFKILTRVQVSVNMVLLIVTPLLVTAQVLLRYVFHMPLMGIEELLLFPIIWLYMLGGANASREKNHIICGILSLYIKKPKSIALFNLTRTVISLIVSLWLTYWALWFFLYSLSRWKLSDLLYLPMFFGESALFIGLLLMTLYTAVELYDYVQVYRKGV
ncbi:MAG: TRAP transporter small permease [Spirochaetia bacterium]|nr:TRAP transporter small permease [Spirochaetia bacterium]